MNADKEEWELRLFGRSSSFFPGSFCVDEQEMLAFRLRQPPNECFLPYRIPRRRAGKFAHSRLRLFLRRVHKSFLCNAQPGARASSSISWQSVCNSLAKEPHWLWRIFVKKRIQSLSFLATLAIAFGMISWGSTLHAQNAPSSTPDRQAQQPSSSPDSTPPQSEPQTSPTPPPSMPDTQSPSQTPDTTAPSSRTPESGAQQSTTGAAADSGAAAGTQTFSGTVTKQGDKYVLKDESGHTYDIDHQDEVKKFEGKRVRVQGTLDPSSNKIMVK